MRTHRLIFALLLFTTAFARADAPTVTLARDGRAALPIVTPADASPRTRAAAQTLATYLGRITGATFGVKTAPADASILVTTDPAQFNSATDPTKREDYLLQSHPVGLRLIGATDLAVEHAVWDLLHRLGYRQFFPSEHWEIVPHTPTLSIAVDAREHPAYLSRRIWYGFGAWDYAKQPYASWCARNRATQSIDLNTGHSYDGILAANKAEFAKHPEYLGLVKGERKSTKFCISNPGLRKLVVDYELSKFAKDPSLDSVSLDPSDGGNWCECDACAKLGSITDRALLLANDVAAAVNAKYPGKLVGIYAYNYHSPPPNITADPHVVVSVATAFLKGGLTLDETLAGWHAKATTLGIREYYSVNVWDRDVPAAARGGNLAYLQRTLPDFYAKGARFLSAESSDNWGPNGLGYYVASRIAWDVREANHLDALVDDFLTRAFGPAKEPMREFYKQLDGSAPHLVVADQLGRMFRAIDASRKLATSAPDVTQRLTDLALYCRYVDLYHRYADAKGDARQQAFEALIRHAYRMRTTMLVHTLALYRDLAGRDKSVTIPPEAKFNVPEGKNSWKSSEPFPPDQIAAYLKEGIDRYPLSDVKFTPVTFSDNLVPAAAALKFTDPTPANATPLGAARGKQVFYTYVDKAPATIDVLITGGLIAHYRDRGNVKLDLFKLGGASQTGERETPVAHDRSVPPDGNEHPVSLPVKEPGLYKLTLNDGDDRTLLRWNCPLPLTVRSSADDPMNKHYTDLWQMSFYVPRGTKVLGFFGGDHGELRDSANRPVFFLNGRDPNFYSVDVPQGEDGKVWTARFCRGSLRLLTVPPYFAPSPSSLLLPAEVVEKDSK